MAQSHEIFEIYKLYVEMADRISQRRQTANSFFLSVTTALLGLSGYLHAATEPSHYAPLGILSFAGLIISYMWHRAIRSYKELNDAKFKVIHEMEKSLPFQPYEKEWRALGFGTDKNVYLPFTGIEKWVPWIFAFIFFISAALSVIRLLGL